MNFLFAWRYFKAKKSTNAINVISWISIVAITGITFAFIVVLSVFNGFEGLVKSLYSSFYTDIRVAAKEGKIITITPRQLQQLQGIKEIRAWSMIAEEKSLLINGEINVPVNLKGVDSAYGQVTAIPKKLIRGTFTIGTEDQPAIVLGNGVEGALAVQSDKNLYPITVYLFKRGIPISAIDPMQSFSASNLATTGTFLIQQEIDNKYAITNIDFMKRMMGLKPDEYTAVEIALHEGASDNDVKASLQKIFGPAYAIETKYEQNKTTFRIMTVEKWVIYGVLTLMLVVAAFTMVGGLTMLVLEKQKDIQVLKALGANNQLIRKIFLTEGLLLAGIGAVAGVLLSIIFCWAEVKYKLIKIEGGTFLIDYYPVKLVATDFLLVVATVSLVAITACWFPSRKAALQPIELKS